MIFFNKIKYKRDYWIIKEWTEFQFWNNEWFWNIIKYYLNNMEFDNIKINLILWNNWWWKTTFLKSFFYNTSQDFDGKLLEFNDVGYEEELPLDKIVIDNYSPFDWIYDFIEPLYNYQSEIYDINYLDLKNVSNFKTSSLKLFFDMCQTEKSTLESINNNLVNNILWKNFFNPLTDVSLEFMISNDYFDRYTNDIFMKENIFLYNFMDNYKKQITKSDKYNFISEYINFISKLYSFATWYEENWHELGIDYKDEKLKDLEMWSWDVNDLLIYFIDIVMLLYNKSILSTFDFDKEYLLSYITEFKNILNPEEYTEFESIIGLWYEYRFGNLEREDHIWNIWKFYTILMKKYHTKKKFFQFKSVEQYWKWKDQVLLNNIFLSKFDIDLKIWEVSYKDFSSGQKILFYRFFQILRQVLSRDKYKEFIVLIDEPDLHLHLDWQRKYIKTLIDIFSNLEDTKIQFIIATHSPFIVSDIPKENIIVLNWWKVEELNNQTFGANYIDLIRDWFFFENKNLMWNFAETVIWKLADEERDIYLENVLDEKKIEDIENKKVVIWDEFLRDNLLYFKSKNND